MPAEFGKNLFGHLEEIRQRLFYSALAWALAFVAFYALRDELYLYFVKPVGVLVYLGPAGAFMLHMKLALFLSAILVLPYWLYQVYGFMAPAFDSGLRRTLASGAVAILLLFYTGAVFGWILLGRSIGFLSGFATDTLKPMVTTDAYFSFVLALVGGCGLIFQTPVVVGLLVRMGLLSTASLRAGWRQALMGSLLVSAFITPSPDAVTQVMLAGPIFGLYLLSIALASFIEKRELATD